MRKNRPKFSQLAIYKQVRRSQLSRRIQDEVLKKMSVYYAKGASLDIYSFGQFVNRVTTTEDWEYWKKMYLDSGCWEEENS